MKGNRQGSLSRFIKQLFETSKKFQKVQQPVEKTFSTGWQRRAGFQARLWLDVSGTQAAAALHGDGLAGDILGIL